MIAPEKKIEAERVLIKLGIQLIINRQQITNGSQLVAGIDEGTLR
jgi:5-methylthioribose kinase